MKQTLVFFLIVFCKFSQAQDSCQLKTQTDPFTHQKKITTGFMPFSLSGTPISISIDATKAEIDVFIWIKDDTKCFDESSTALINFEGEKLKATYRNTGSMNCEGAFHFSFRNTPSTPSNLKRLMDKRIASIKLVGNGKTETEILFSEDQKNEFMKKAGCVIVNAKGLLQ